jgi:hypothetical protein
LHAGEYAGYECIDVVVTDDLDEEDAGGMQAAVGLLDRGSTPPADRVGEHDPAPAADRRLGLGEVGADRFDNRSPVRAGIVDERDVRPVLDAGDLDLDLPRPRAGPEEYRRGVCVRAVAVHRRVSAS